MRQDKAVRVARILLIFSVADVALAAPAVVRQRVAVIPASKKRTESTDSDSDWSRVSPSPSFHESHHLHPFVYNFICRLGAPCPASFHGSEPWDSPPDSPPHDSTPASPAESEAPLHDDPTPVATDDPTPVATTTSAHGDLAPEAKSIFSDELKRRIKILSAVAAVYTVSASVIYGGILKAKDKHSSRADTVDRDLGSSDSAGTYPRPEKNPVSRGFSNLRVEDSRLLNVLTRRTFEGLD